MEQGTAPTAPPVRVVFLGTRKFLNAQRAITTTTIITTIITTIATTTTVLEFLLVL